MKFSVLQENLNTALSHVSRFVSAKTQLPILKNILFAIDNGRLKLSATDLKIGINYWIGAKIEKESSITVPAKEITEFISYLSPGKLDISVNDKSLLSVHSPNAQSSFTTMPSDDFPTQNTSKKKYTFDLDYSLLSETVAQIAFAAATDDNRPVLTAVLWQFTPQAFTMVATDGFRLSVKTSKLINPINLDKQQSPVTFLIPSKALSEIVRLSKNEKKINVALTNDERQVVFVLEDLELLTRLIEGDYPDYQKIIPKEFNTKLTIDKEDFSQAIKIASVFARESANIVRFKVDKNSVELTANAPQVGQNKNTLEAKVEGESMEIAFNYKFISDFLSICKGDFVTVKLNQSLSPGIFEDQNDPNFTHVIMPVRLQD
ncbi:DNA polymerase III subunit beta [Patescibacteria group bacterium]|nr:DNA polymerase III subunit beta [Patescibacteria group bacterium]